MKSFKFLLITMLQISSAPAFADVKLVASIPGESALALDSNELTLVRQGKVHRFSLQKRTIKEEKSLSHVSVTAIHDFCSNESHFLELKMGEKRQNVRVIWTKPPVIEPSKQIYSGSIDKTSCDLASATTSQPVSAPSHMCDAYNWQKVWGSVNLYCYAKAVSFKEGVSFPLGAVVFDRSRGQYRSMQLPAGPWVHRYGFFFELKYFSCGPDCYIKFSSFAVQGQVYAIVSGAAVTEGGAGLFLLAGQKWKRLNKDKSLSSRSVISNDGRYFAVGNGTTIYLYERN